jgi:hypothetical protein
MLQWTLKKEGVGVLNGFNWLSNKSSAARAGEEILDKLKNYQLLKKSYCPWS